MSSSPWSSSADPNSIWNSPNLNILRRYSLRSSTIGGANPATSTPIHSSSNHVVPNTLNKSTCSWEQSADGKYLVGYIVIHRQDLGIDNAMLGFNICGGRPTYDGQYGAIVEHVVPGSIMNLICKLKVGDEIVEWNGFNLRNKRNDEVCDIIESVKNANSLRLVAIRMLNNDNNNINNNNSQTCGANNNKNTDVKS